MLLFKQLDLFADAIGKVVGGAASFPSFKHGRLPASPTIVSAARDFVLEGRARALLESLGATRVAASVSVEWNGRLRTSAGRADYRRKLITLNPRLRQHGEAEIERTFLHELAHLLAQNRSGRRRIEPHGLEWRQACSDLGIAGEQRCHALPFPHKTRVRPFLYRCPQCGRDFPRVRRVRRGIACLACCRRFNRGRYDKRFQLRLVQLVPQV